MGALKLPTTVRITEVGPRDGLQNEQTPISTDDKVRFVELLADTGLPEIEVTSFVNPKWVPQLADAAEVMARIERRAGVVYSALVPNQRGLERALAAGADKIAVFTAASETFSQRNTNATVDETLARFKPVVGTAKGAGVPVRAYVSCIVACPYEGPVDPARVRAVTQRLLDLGVDEIDLGETLGVAVPTDIERVYDELDGLLEPADTVLHLHDTRGTALAVALRALDLGVWRFDASCVGLGGCPYAPGAAGNLATEDLVYMCDRMGCRTGVDLPRLFAAGRQISTALRRNPTGRVFGADGAAADASGRL